MKYLFGFLLFSVLLFSTASTAGAVQWTVTVSPGTCPKCLDGSKSFDNDGTIVSYRWYLEGILIGTGVKPTVTLRPGTHVIILLVRDNEGAVDTDDVVVTVKRVKGGKGGKK